MKKNSGGRNAACLAALVALTSIAAAEQTSEFTARGVTRTPGARDLAAFYREGQSFLTWREDDSVSGEWYKIYTSAEPITEDNLAEATFIAEIPEDEQLLAPLAELPWELEDLVGDLVTSEEEMRPEGEDIGSYLNSLDHTAEDINPQGGYGDTNQCNNDSNSYSTAQSMPP